VKKIVILISGRGSNMQALIDAKLPCRIAAVISNRADAPGLEIAKQHGIPTQLVAHKNYAERAAFDTALAGVIDSYQPDFVVLAGFMRILTEQFVNRYRARLVNIHPSLLPAYAGMNTHERALQDGVKIHGCTIHFVTPDLDHGPVIIQAAVPVLHDDTPQILSARVLQQEHIIYPRAIRWLCDGTASLNAKGRVVFKGAEHAHAALIAPAME